MRLQKGTERPQTEKGWTHISAGSSSTFTGPQRRGGIDPLTEQTHVDVIKLRKQLRGECKTIVHVVLSMFCTFFTFVFFYNMN